MDLDPPDTSRLLWNVGHEPAQGSWSGEWRQRSGTTGITAIQPVCSCATRGAPASSANTTTSWGSEA
jgi:hypothetical protein